MRQSRNMRPETLMCCQVTSVYQFLQVRPDFSSAYPRILDACQELCTHGSRKSLGTLLLDRHQPSILEIGLTGPHPDEAGIVCPDAVQSGYKKLQLKQG